MAKVEGITIELRGKTTELEQALRKVNNEVKKTDKELRNVEKALKLDPKNVDLWRAKQDLLKNKISETGDKLKALKDAQAKVDSGEVEMASSRYEELKRDIAVTEAELKQFNTELKKTGNANLKALSEQFKSIGSNMKAAGQTMTASVTAPIVAGYTLASKYASDYEENLNKLDVAFGDNSKSVKEWANNARTAYGLSKVQATDAASAFGALGKGIGLTEKEAADMSTTLAGLSADLGSYFNVGVAESSKALEGIFTGESEALKKFGVVMTDTNLKQFAEDQGLVWSAMSQTEKTMLRYQYVLDKTKDAQGDFSRTSDGTANSTKIFQASLQDLGTAIGTNLLPIITPIIQKITEWVNKFNELSPSTQRIITIIGLVVAAIGPVLVVLGTLISSIGSIIGVMGMVTAPMLGIVAVIAAVVAAGVLLYQNWDLIKAKAIAFKDGVIAAFNTFKANVIATFTSVATAIVTPIQNAINKVKAIIDKIKSWFPIKVGNLLSGLKLPHFKLTGEFSLKNKTVPHLSVDWYKTGGIFDSPSVIGVGEAGSEAVVPLDKLWEKLDNIANASGNGNIIINVNGANKDPRMIAEEVKRILIRETKQRRLAWQ